MEYGIYSTTKNKRNTEIHASLLSKEIYYFSHPLHHSHRFVPCKVGTLLHIHRSPAFVMFISYWNVYFLLRKVINSQLVLKDSD